MRQPPLKLTWHEKHHWCRVQHGYDDIQSNQWVNNRHNHNITVRIIYTTVKRNLIINRDTCIRKGRINITKAVANIAIKNIHIDTSTRRFIKSPPIHIIAERSIELWPQGKVLQYLLQSMLWWAEASAPQWARHHIDWRSLGCAVWNAQWGPSDDLKGMMWQYTSNEYIPNGGRNGYFDANIIYE